MTVAIKNNNKTPLVVPPAVRRRAGFKSGQELEIKASAASLLFFRNFRPQTTNIRRSSDVPSTAALLPVREITKRAGRTDRSKHTRSSSPRCTRKQGNCAARKSKRAANDSPLLEAFLTQLFQSAESGPGSVRQTVAVLAPGFTSPFAPREEVRRSQGHLAGPRELHLAFLFQDRGQRISHGRDQEPSEINE